MRRLRCHLRIEYRNGKICFSLLSPSESPIHEGCFPPGESESGGWKWEVGPTEDGIRVHSIEGDLDNARYWYRRAGRDFPEREAVQQEIAVARRKVTP